MPFGSGGSGGGSATPVRTQSLLGAIGLLAEPVPSISASVTAAPTSQRIYGSGVYLYADEVVTSIVLCANAAPAGTPPTACKVGLWSSAATPVCVAVSGDLSAAASWAANFNTQPLSPAYTVPVSGLYYAAFLVNGAWGGTNMTLTFQGSLMSLQNPVTGAKRRMPGLSTTATDMAVNDTGAYALASTSVWLGVS